MSVEERLHELGLHLPEPPKPVAAYVPAVRTDETIFVSGQVPLVSGKLAHQGRVGHEVNLEEAQDAARLCALNCLAVVSAMINLDDVAQIVKVTGYVAANQNFTDQPKVINGASMMLTYVFGPAGRHARAAVGVFNLPLGAPVEVEMIVRAKPEAKWLMTAWEPQSA
jgi:enamine deaminase RidA (YjgF/YER057c/UK114 family)